jgi:CRISPR-associated protein (TIGR03984 family)
MKSNQIPSEVTPLDQKNWKTKLAQMNGCSVILWNYGGQYAGKVSDNTVICSDGSLFEESKIFEIRIFDKTKELYMKRSRNGELVGRLRIDGEQTQSEAAATTTYTDFSNILYGSVVPIEGGEHSTLKEDRGIEVTIPGKFPANKRVALTIRNYIDYNDIGMAGYVDARFVELKSIEK